MRIGALLLALLLISCGGKSATGPEYEKAIQIDPDYVDAHYNLASVH